MKLNKAVSNPMLVGAIKVMKEEPTVEHKKLMLGEIVKAEYMMPVIFTPEPRHGDDGLVYFDECEMQFPTLTNGNGETFFMAFSSKDEFEKWRPDEKKYSFACTYEDFFLFLMKRDPEGKGQALGFVIDPFGHNIVVDRDMVLNLFVRKNPPKTKK